MPDVNDDTDEFFVTPPQFDEDNWPEVIPEIADALRQLQGMTSLEGFGWFPDIRDPETWDLPEDEVPGDEPGGHRRIPKWSFLLRVTPEEVLARRGDEVDFTIHVRGINNVGGVVKIERLDIPWSGFVPAQVSIFPEELSFHYRHTHQATLRVRISSDAEFKTYPVGVTVTYQRPGGTLTQWLSAWVTFRVLAPLPPDIRRTGDPQ